MGSRQVVENLDRQEVEVRDHDFGTHVDMAGNDYDEDHGVLEMIGVLYATAEAQGEQPRFARVLEDAKKSLSPGSRHSKFSFLVRMLYINLCLKVSIYLDKVVIHQSTKGMHACLA
jgi:hypothetical protein